jgi:uncharacterized protein (TIGR04222 family)
VYSSLGALRAAGAVEAAAGGKITVTGLPPAGASDLDRAVHAAAGRGVRASAMHRDATVAAALDATERRLVDAGALYSDRQRTRQRWGSYALFVLAGLGAARIVAGLDNHKPVLYVVVATMGVFLLARLLWRVVPRTTRRGKRMLRRLRDRHAHLAPKLSPSWATYGATGAALGVALFGTAALWEADPVFAEQANIGLRQAAGSSYSSGNTSGGSDGGGGGCGGGGCGGGGCGGGGCGG